MRKTSPSGRNGFSAVELMTVLAIIGVMVLISAPAMINFWNGMKVRTAAHRLMSHARLCRQVAVSRRANVMMELQRTNGSTQPAYKAWEERSSPNNLVRDPNGVDAAVNTADDERWVVRDERQMGLDKVKFSDSYNDTTPTNPADDPGSSIMNSTGVMRLKFFPNGQVIRINDANAEERNDTQIRIRLRRKVTGTRVDQWDITLNRVGKVSSDYLKVAPPE